MALLKFSVREVSNRPVRTILTILSIVIAVGAVVSVSIATTTTRVAQQNMFAAVTGKAALEVVAEGGGSFSVAIANEIDKLEGVQAVPLIRRYTIIYLPDRKVKAQVMGIIPERDQLVRDYEVVSGRMFAAGSEVAVDATFARSLGLSVGDSMKMLTRSGMKTSEIVGLVKPRSGSAVAEGGLLYMSLGLAQSRFKLRGEIDAVQIVLGDEVDVEAMQREVASHLPVGIVVRQPNMRSQLAEETMLATEQGLQLATAFALVIAAFIIFNTFQMTVGERRRQLGILRAIGATRWQVTLLILREGLLIGLIGMVLGGAVGYFGARVLARATSGVLQTPMPDAEITITPFILAAVFGLGISLLATLIPARRAGRLSPSEAMRAVTAGEIEATHLWSLVIGAIVFATGISGLAGCIIGWFPIEVSVTSAVIALVGVVLLLPVGLSAATGFVHLLIRPWLDVEGRLARRQLLRHRGRTSMTIGVLFIAISTGVGLANTIVDNVRDVNQWYRQAIVGDFFVRAMMPDMATGQAADMPEGLDREIKAIPGVEGLDTIRFVQATSADNSVIVVVREFTGDQQVYFDLVDGDDAEVMSGIAEGKVVLGSVLAQRTGLGRGDIIPLETREGEKHLSIVGTTNDYIGGGLTIYMHRATAKELLGVEGVDAYIIQADSGHLAAVESSLQKLCEERGLLLQSYTDLVQFIESMMNGVIGSLWALLALGFVIAAFGLVNTLAMNILEQTRELGVLRVVAMTRRQVRKTILAQAIMMGLIGLAPGAVLGLAVAYFINLATLPTTGHAVLFVFRPWLLLGSFVITIGIVLIAAWLPAERAARLKLSDALRYE
ncbi:MAG: ABC transporter permease [Planctomycetaceae bacterium]|nr:ABC transporter permease [Planctomycetales bacterium]MCB9875620.1 ABC transporter permease [Planctomycetaceae bacterium]HRX79076.1 FtsX-like permease family protein [Pirellulaceae bacterium]